MKAWESRTCGLDTRRKLRKRVDPAAYRDVFILPKRIPKSVALEMYLVN